MDSKFLNIFEIRVLEVLEREALNSVITEYITYDYLYKWFWLP